MASRRILDALASHGALYGWITKSPEKKIETAAVIAGIVNECAEEQVKAFVSFIDWWAKIVHAGHKDKPLDGAGEYVRDWKKCPMVVCHSAWESLKELRPQEVVSPQPAEATEQIHGGKS